MRCLVYTTFLHASLQVTVTTKPKEYSTTPAVHLLHCFVLPTSRKLDYYQHSLRKHQLHTHSLHSIISIAHLVVAMAKFEELSRVELIIEYTDIIQRWHRPGDLNDQALFVASLAIVSTGLVPLSLEY
jgi:hypothetical protein